MCVFSWQNENGHIFWVVVSPRTGLRARRPVRWRAPCSRRPPHRVQHGQGRQHRHKGGQKLHTERLCQGHARGDRQHLARDGGRSGQGHGLGDGQHLVRDWRRSGQRQGHGRGDRQHLVRDERRSGQVRSGQRHGQGDRQHLVRDGRRWGQSGRVAS